MPKPVRPTPTKQYQNAAPTAVATAVEAAAAAIPVEAAAAAIVVAVTRRRGRQRPLGGGLELRGRATELGARRSEDAGLLGPHAQHAPAARGQDLEVEAVEADAEVLAGEPQGLLDALARELAIRI